MYEKYVISQPLETFDYLYHDRPDTPFKIFMNKDLVPEATVSADVFYRTEIPKVNPTCELHSHPTPQLLMFVGEEGTFEVKVPLNDEVFTITKTTMIWVPPHVKHNVTYIRIDKPMVESGILLQGEYA
ncbi:cupin domain-containing protein [Capillibacterium thermochitinicola]|uniref:Cupin domain-containing protein n=1 Tax=Capillibacterium thermochitinicola TaxID=2699427 RepID=A0A8J6HZG8_9FIRM|nr:hypothetical protein [Capillibacterium thermochitinicola]MBA2132203.1 hypothetical protein [Capillibacterium thermochitinicola]